MKAVINVRYGSPDVLEIRQVPKPEPKAGEVLIRVHATTVSRTDCGMLRPHPFFVRFVAGLRRPKRTILGMDFAATDLGPWCQNPLLVIWSSINGSHRVIFPLPQSSKAKAFVDFLKTRMEAGEFRAVIDREYPLEAIADAYRYVETGQKTGIVVINVRPADENAHA